MNIADLLYLAADSVPIWRPYAVAILAGVTIAAVAAFAWALDR